MASSNCILEYDRSFSGVIVCGTFVLKPIFPQCVYLQNIHSDSKLNYFFRNHCRNLFLDLTTKCNYICRGKRKYHVTMAENALKTIALSMASF